MSEVKGQSLTGDGFSLSLSLAFLRLLFSLFFPAPAAAVEAAEDEEEGRGLTVLLDFLYRASAGASNWGRVEGGREGGKGMRGESYYPMHVYLYCC